MTRVRDIVRLAKIIVVIEDCGQNRHLAALVTSLKRQHFVIGQISALFQWTQSPAQDLVNDDHLFFVDSKNVIEPFCGGWHK
jgi:hypothetical protein